MVASPNVRFRRLWLKLMLIVLLIVETSFLTALVLAPVVQSMNYGGFRYGCANLQGSPDSNDSVVRWVRFTCPSGPALSLSPSYFECGVKENSCTKIFPTLTPPRGLLGLYAVDHTQPGCPNHYLTYGRLLVSGVGEVYGAYGFPATQLDYCAAMKISAGTLEGFNVQWFTGYGVPGPSYDSLYPSNVTIAPGSNANVTLTLVSIRKFSGNFSFIPGPVLRANATSKPTLSFSPLSVMLKADGSVATTITVQVSSTVSTGAYTAFWGMTQVYGLTSYGDFCPSCGLYGSPNNMGYGMTVYVT